MNSSTSPSMARILLSPWQQRLSIGGRWSLFVVVAACLAIPALLLVASLFGDPGQQASMLRGATKSLWICLFAILVMGWAMLVSNVLQQNHPTLARLVPHHPVQLRAALLVAWAMVSLAAAAMPGFAFGAPLAWACGAAGGLALLATVMRWPMLGLSGIAAPVAVNALTSRYDPDSLGEAIWTQWVGHDLLWTGVVVTAGAFLLVVMIRGGGAAHRASYESRQRMRQHLQAQQGCGSDVPGSLKGLPLGGLALNRRLYGWWLDRLLSRHDSPVMSRLLAGLGPATHWTSRVFEGGVFMLVGGGTCLLVSSLLGGAVRSGVLPWISYSVLIGACVNALQAVPRLQQSQREQGLLVLLPGVPRGVRLNRWLAWQMSAVFVVTALCALIVAWAFNQYADWLAHGIVARATSGVAAGAAAALLPQVAWQWRGWARLRGSSTGNQVLPVSLGVAMGPAIDALHAITHVGFLTVGIVLAIASLAWCAWRWHRMASEPSAFPVGRLA